MGCSNCGRYYTPRPYSSCDYDSGSSWFCSNECRDEKRRNGCGRAEFQRRQEEQQRKEAERIAIAATGLEPLFQAIGLDTDAQSLQRAMTWLKQQGANKVADLNQLRPGTYTCKDLADGLGLPMLEAHRLLLAIEGASQHHAAKAPAPIQPIQPPPPPQLAPMFAHMAIAALPRAAARAAPARMMESDLAISLLDTVGGDSA
jgi:hypothetical protein